jgi:RNA polymerase sigma factor (sigma-70 family)
MSDPRRQLSKPAQEDPIIDARAEALVRRVQAGDPSAMSELYQLVARGIRFYLCRQFGPADLEDRVHDAFVMVVEAIRRDELRDPSRLMGFVRTVVRRLVANFLVKRSSSRQSQVSDDSGEWLADLRTNPEQAAISQEEIDLARRILRKMHRRDREVLERFYLREQSQEQICEEMRITGTQFRLLKNRAKSRFGELGRRKLFS